MARRNAFAAGAALVAALSVSGFVTGAHGQETANLRVWFMQDSVSDKAAEWLSTEFAAENPGSTLTVEVQPWTDIVSRLLTSLASKSETPDIVEIGEKAVERMLARGPLHRQLMRNLRVYKGDAHPHEAQNPEKLDIAKLNRKNVRA